MNIKKVIVGFIGIVVSLVIIVVITIKIISEPIPQGEEGDRAEQLAENMLSALNKPAWDSLKSISWVYPIGNHKYIWNKAQDEVSVFWDENKVILNTKTRVGKVFKNDKLIDFDQKLIEKAFKYFYNDSFWLIAPYKLKDPGTIRKVVNYNGRDALLVQYTSGGTTPGDSYLWILDDNYKPIAWKFWASIIPIGGMEFTWEKWENIDGAQISTLHRGIIDIEIKLLQN